MSDEKITHAGDITYNAGSGLTIAASSTGGYYSTGGSSSATFTWTADKTSSPMPPLHFPKIDEERFSSTYGYRDKEYFYETGEVPPREDYIADRIVDHLFENSYGNCAGCGENFTTPSSRSSHIARLAAKASDEWDTIVNAAETTDSDKDDEFDSM